MAGSVEEPEGDDERHKEALESYKRAHEREQDNHEHQRAAIKFAEGRGQWPDDVKRARVGRPCLTFNRIPAAVNNVINKFRKDAPQIKVRPVDNLSDPGTAEMLGGLIRNIEDQSQATQIYETQGKLMTIGGWGVIRVDYDYFDSKSFDPELRILNEPEPLNWVPGEYSSPDATDAKEWFGDRLVDKDDYEAKYGKVENWDSYIKELPDDWMTEDKVRICEHWYKEPYKRQLVKTPTGEVFDTAKVPPQMLEQILMQGGKVKEVDATKIRRVIMDGCRDLSNEIWPGELIPIVAVIGNELRIDGKNVRYGMVKDAMDPQRQYNFSRTSQTEKIALGPKAPYIGPSEAFEGHEDVWATANTANHAFLAYEGPIAPQRNVVDTVTQGEIEAARMAVDDLTASFGAPTNGDLGDPRDAVDTVLLRKKDEDTATFQYSDNLARAVAAVGRVLLDLIPNVYTNDRWVRIKGQDGNTNVVQLNSEYIDPQTGQKLFYDLSRGKYDVTVSVGESYTTMREEGANALVQVMGAYQQAAGVLAPRLFKMLDFPGAQEVAQQLEQMEQQKQQQGPQDPAAAAMQIENAKTQSQMQINQAKAQADMMQMQSKDQLERQRAQFDAQLKIHQMQKEADIEIAKATRLLQIEAVKKDQTAEIKALQSELQHLAGIVQQLTAPSTVQ